MRPLLCAALLATPVAAAEPPVHPQAAFFAQLETLCGKAFEGRVEASEPAGADRDFETSRLVMHVRTCAPHEIRIPFHVGDDASRTWVITRQNRGIALKHDHRHKDGSEDALTQYGGMTATPGTPARQEFPADQFSRDMFTRQDRAVSVPNVWALEVGADHFTYELARPGRLVRVRFDTTRAVAAPPPPWGAKP